VQIHEADRQLRWFEEVLQKLGLPHPWWMKG
jgi:hypothetical protein